MTPQDQQHSERPLRLGRIGYLNVLPIYYPLENGLIHGDFEVVSGPPASLNDLMSQGLLDISASSSIEYARRPERYRLLPDIAIGSRGPVQSVLLLSRVPVSRLDRETILVSAQTHTSAALLRVLCARRWNIAPSFVTGDATSLLEQGQRPKAILAIGDEALMLRHHADYPVKVDMGEAWREWTGLPFIFGVWITQVEALGQRPERTLQAIDIMLRAKHWGTDNMPFICSYASEHGPLSQPEMCSYMDGLVYDFREEEQAGLRLFCRYLQETGQIDTAPPLRFAL